MPEHTVSIDAAVSGEGLDRAVDADPVRDGVDRRAGCPVARGADGSRMLHRHADVRTAALDDVTFSNATSRFLKLPNGLDGAEHTAFRALVDRYLTDDRLAVIRPMVASVAEEVVGAVGGLPARVDAVELGARFAVRTSCAWLGWPESLHGELLRWIVANRAATRSGERERTAAVAAWFDSLVHSQVVARREHPGGVEKDVTAQLVDDESLGRLLTDDEITSILRNWTGGDLDSLALCAGVVLAYLADHGALQERLRAMVAAPGAGGVSEPELDAVVDEILRIDNPFVASRRVATTDGEVGGRLIAGGERVVLHWADANRDPEVFGDPDVFDPVGNAAHNLVYGVGRHVCPGRRLATMQLRLLTQAVLARTSDVAADPDRARERSRPPSGGYCRVPLVLS